MGLLNRWRTRSAAPETGEATLIVGLGNPGREYANNRHNVGFMLADRVAARYDTAFSKVQNQTLLALARLPDRRVIIAKPQTYMNDSGRAVSALLNFYKIPIERLIVAYDELDLPFGTLRLRPDGGAGGHNGMRSIIGQLGTNRFARVRVGIGRPPGRMDPAAFVLQDFGQAERAELPALLERATKALEVFIDAGIVAAMNQYNATLTGEKDVP